MITPREKPKLSNLNSYYLDIQKLFEHCQGEFGSGCAHLRSPRVEGLIFFDKDELLNGVWCKNGNKSKGKRAIECLMEATRDHNFTIDIYAINAEEIYFWSTVPGAQEIYRDLSTEFTDFEGLLNKMRLEKFTGYIDVSINSGKEGGLLFFKQGENIGGSCSWESRKGEGLKENERLLIEKVREWGGTFQVSRISLADGKRGRKSKGISGEGFSNILAPLEELLRIVERAVSSDKKIKKDFSTLLKKEFVDMADRYVFLDPFAAEFEYSDQKITFAGNASEKDLAEGVIRSVRELTEEMGMFGQLTEGFSSWSQKHEMILGELGVGL